MSNPPYLQKIGREINRRLLEVERVSHNSGLSGDSIQRVVQPTVTADAEKAPALKFGQPRVMALFVALALFQHLVDGFHNRDLRQHVITLLGVTSLAIQAFAVLFSIVPINNRIMRCGMPHAPGSPRGNNSTLICNVPCNIARFRS